MKKKKKALFGSKDMGVANSLIPVAQEMLRRGYDIVAAVEGLGQHTWKERLPETIVFEGSENFEQQPFNFNAEALLTKIQPDLVVTGLSKPINIEEQLSLAANRRRIKLAQVEDIWGAHMRSQARPDVITTLDPVSKALIKREPRLARTHVADCGSPALDGLVDPPLKTRDAVAAARGKGKILMLAGEGGYTSETLRVTFESLKQSRNWKAIIRLHPKKLQEFGHVWNPMIAAFKAERPDQLVELDLAGYNEGYLKTRLTDDLARLCDLTLSASSTTLLIAAAGGGQPVSIRTPATQVGISETMPGLERYPLVDVGACLEISGPTNLDDLYASSLYNLERSLPYLRCGQIASAAVDALEHAIFS